MEEHVDFVAKVEEKHAAARSGHVTLQRIALLRARVSCIQCMFQFLTLFICALLASIVDATSQHVVQHASHVRPRHVPGQERSGEVAATRSDAVAQARSENLLENLLRRISGGVIRLSSHSMMVHSYFMIVQIVSGISRYVVVSTNVSSRGCGHRTHRT